MPKKTKRELSANKASQIAAKVKRAKHEAADAAAEPPLDDVPDCADEPAGDLLDVAHTPKLANANVVVEEVATESVSEAPSTAIRRANARSHTPELEPDVADETTALPLMSTSTASNAHVGDDSVLDIDNSSTPQESSSLPDLTVCAPSV